MHGVCLRSGAGGIDSQNRGSGAIGEFQMTPWHIYEIQMSRLSLFREIPIFGCFRAFLVFWVIFEVLNSLFLFEFQKTVFN